MDASPKQTAAQKRLAKVWRQFNSAQRGATGHWSNTHGIVGSFVARAQKKHRTMHTAALMRMGQVASSVGHSSAGLTAVLA